MLRAGGDIAIDGDITAGKLQLDAAGTEIVRNIGALVAGTVSGSGQHLVDLGTGADIARLGAFSVTGSEFALNNAVPLTILGPLSAEYISIGARGQITLAGDIATRGVVQTGPLPLAPGSNLIVLPGPNGTGFFIQTGVSNITPLNAPFANLASRFLPRAGSCSSVICARPRSISCWILGTRSAGGGNGVGTLQAGQLLVLGAGGGATLFGTVAGQGGIVAARDAAIEPGPDPAYTLNGCEIGSAFCGGSPVDLALQLRWLLNSESIRTMTRFGDRGVGSIDRDDAGALGRVAA